MQLPSLKGAFVCIFKLPSGEFFLWLTMKTITKLYFNKASYFVGDDLGNVILLKVNYYENKFSIKNKIIKNGNISLLTNEAQVLAKDLLKRKSGVNRA